MKKGTYVRRNIKKGETVWYVTAIYAKPSGEKVKPSAYLDGWDSNPAVPQWLAAEISG